MLLPSVNVENLNHAIFLLLNAPAQATPALLAVGKASASWLIALYPLVLLIYWFSFNRQKQQAAFLALVTALAALAINLGIGSLFPYPRPFMVPVGHTFMSHVADASFPSDHMTLACSIALSLLLSKRRATGTALLLLSLLIAWGRIYMGVHFPLDMLGSLMVAMLCAVGVKRGESAVMPLFEKLSRLNTYCLLYLKIIRAKN